MTRLTCSAAVIAAVILSFCFSTAGQTAVPDSLNFQGYLTDQTGSPIDGDTEITFSIYSVEIGGSPLWAFTQTVPLDQGLFSVKLGGPTALFPVDLFDTPLWLGIEVGSDGEMMPRRALTSAAFAFKADDALTLTGQSAAALNQGDHVIDTTNPHAVNAAQAGAASSADITDLQAQLDAALLTIAQLQTDIANETADRIADVNAEEAARIAADDAESSARIETDSNHDTWIEIIRFNSVLQLDGILALNGNTALFTGVNVQVVSGSGTTDGAINGLGNLIVGYNPPDTTDAAICSLGRYDNQRDCEANGEVWAQSHKSGSHNVVIGDQHSYSRFGGLVTGLNNNITGQWTNVSGGYGNTAGRWNASVSGGAVNTASNSYSSVSGGAENTTSGRYSSVSGGNNNVASGLLSSVSGGNENTASGQTSSVSGGYTNTALGTTSSVSGGQNNLASALLSSISGGDNNTASGDSSSISGGAGGTASGQWSSVSGGESNTASGTKSSISGGSANLASGDWSSVSGGSANMATLFGASVSGGRENTASGHQASVSGGENNTASLFYSSVSGGRNNTADGAYSSVGGGRHNIASGQAATVPGGGGPAPADGNEAFADYSVVLQTFEIGDTGPAGGIVFHITDGGHHGLEAAPVYQAFVEWGCHGTEITGADGLAVGTGAQNTADIIAGCTTPGIAAEYAVNYSLNGFNDWFLPSQDELNLMFLNLHSVGLGGFLDVGHWSSSENSSIEAWFQMFFNGDQMFGLKSGNFRVRAVRVF